jgi:hypothetical protein
MVLRRQLRPRKISRILRTWDSQNDTDKLLERPSTWTCRT